MKERRIRLALVIHNHQPVGNTDSIIERIYRTSYLPFIKKLVAHPLIKINLHYTGFLLEWFENHHPDFIILLKELVQRGQVELVGGAYYEPVISVIPDKDVSGQTDLLTEKIRFLFDVDPVGFWTAERAWEPTLPEILTSIGARHTVIDDVSFESSGLTESECFEPYLLESRGNFVTVLPILKKLRYYIPFKSVATTINFLRQAADQNRGIAVYADDGEKFGAWPTTFERVYKEGWLDSFLETVTKNDWIETVKLSEYLGANPATKRIYLPASTYSEMMDWAIPLYGNQTNRHEQTDTQKIIPLRGFWRLFLAKYQESANMYAKMLRLSRKIRSLGSSDNEEALIDLWKGQCNDAYWHGVFGGLYAPILRKITFSNLIKAQVGYEKSCFGSMKNWLISEESDISGNEEIHVDNEHLGLTIFPRSGGAVSEIDFKPIFVNLSDTLTRRPERYHRQIRKLVNRTIVPSRGKTASIHDTPKFRHKGLEKLLIYDRYPKYSFVDYFLEDDSSIRSFEQQDFRESVKFPDSAYEAEIQKSNTEVVINMVSRSSNAEYNIDLVKMIHVPADSAKFRVDYQIQMSNPDSRKLSGLFVPEINLGSLSDGSFGDRYRKSITTNLQQLEIRHEDLGVQTRINLQDANSCWIVPIKTVSLSESGFESNLQGISVLPNYQIELTSNDGSFKTSIELQMDSI